MSLQGSVMCNCYKDGNTKPPPIERERIYFEDGFAYAIFPEGTPEKDTYDTDDALYEWQKTACEHEHMRYEYVECYHRNAALFTEIAYTLGRYPVLAELYPHGNGGSVEVNTVKAAAIELEQFVKELGGVQMTHLVNSDSGDSLTSVVSGSSFIAGLWVNREGYRIEFDTKGLLITSLTTNELIFRAMGFRKEPLDIVASVSPRGYKSSVQMVRLIDTDNPKNTAVVPDFWQEHNSMNTVVRPVTEDDLYCINPLRKLIAASLETGNPINWI